jgi:hypothetical protein
MHFHHFQILNFFLATYKKLNTCLATTEEFSTFTSSLPPELTSLGVLTAFTGPRESNEFFPEQLSSRTLNLEVSLWG